MRRVFADDVVIDSTQSGGHEISGADTSRVKKLLVKGGR